MRDRGYSAELFEQTVELVEYVDSCIDIDTFLPFCQSCDRYGNNWSCPPFDFSPMEIWQKYREIRLFAVVVTFEAEMAAETALEIMEREKINLHNLILAQEAATPGSLALAPGSCTLCGDSACLRRKNLPCPNKKTMRYSIEALGGDVVKTAEVYFNRPVLWINEGVVPPHMVCIGALLG